MKICHCTLTGSEACKNCSNTLDGINYGNDSYQPKFKTIKRYTKTIEKYGPNGEYLGKEIIITDEEDIQVQDWDYGTWVGSGSTTGVDGGKSFSIN